MALPGRRPISVPIDPRYGGTSLDDLPPTSFDAAKVFRTMSVDELQQQLKNPLHAYRTLAEQELARRGPALQELTGSIY